MKNKDKFAYYIPLSKISEQRQKQLLEIMSIVQTIAQNHIKFLLNVSDVLNADILVLCKEKGVPSKLYGLKSSDENSLAYLKSIYPVFGRTRYKNFIKHLKSSYEY